MLRQVFGGWPASHQEQAHGPLSEGTEPVTAGGTERSLPWGRGVLSDTRLARVILLTVLCGFLVVQAIDILTSPVRLRGLALATGYPAIVAIFILQVVISSSAAPSWPLWRRLLMLAGQAAATYLPLLAVGAEWAGMAGFLAGSSLLLLPSLAGWGAFAAIAASMLIGPIELGLIAYTVAYLVVATIDIGLVVFGLSRLSMAVRYVYAARSELAQLAIAKERVRFARDLHDLLGYSLSAITLKAELARRLIGTNQGRSRDELAEILDISRQALADVRTVSSGYRNLSLTKEAGSVAALLNTAGIKTKLDMSCGALEERTDTVLATILRESVTNILRHSNAKACRIEAYTADETIRLRVLNDGVPRSTPSHRSGGGLENLATRLDAIGGRLTARTRDDGHFDVLAEVPVQAVTPAAEDTDLTSLPADRRPA